MFLVLCLALACAATLQEAVDRRFVHDRGGDLFVLPKEGLVLGNSAVVQRGAHKNIPDVVLSEMLAHSLALPPLRVAESAAYFSHESPLHRRRLAVILAIEGEGKSLALPAVHALHADVGVVDLLETSFAQDNNALLASASTGLPVARHGVVGESYFSRDRVHHSNPNRLVASFGDRVAAGGGDVFVASGSSVLSELLGSGGLSWSSSRGRFVSHAAGAAGVAVDARLPGLVESLGLEWRGAEALLDGALFAPASIEHDRLFLAELELLVQQARAFRVRAAAPGFFGFAVSGLRGLVGEAKRAAARRACDRAVAAALRALESGAGGAERVAWQLLLLDQARVVAAAQTAATRAQPELTGWALHAGGADVFQTREGACEHLASLLWTRDGLTAVCPRPTASALLPRAVPVMRQSAPPADNSTGIDAEEVVAFQLILWLSVGLFLALLMGASTISSVDIPSDSPLLRNLPDIYKETVSLREVM